MLEDLRFAFRQLVKNPGFTLIAIFALALGIGANTAIFSVVNAVLLKPLPYPDADKLIVLRERSHIFDRGAVGYMNWLDWHASQRSFTELSLARRENFNFSAGTGVGAPERIRGLRASSGTSPQELVSGVKPGVRTGRLFRSTPSNSTDARGGSACARRLSGRHGPRAHEGPRGIGQRTNICPP